MVGMLPVSPTAPSTGIATVLSSTAYTTLGIFCVSPPTPAMKNFDTTVDIAVASTIGSADDDSADATVGIFPMSPITTTVSPTTFVAEASVGLFPAFRSLRRPCDDS